MLLRTTYGGQAKQAWSAEKEQELVGLQQRFDALQQRAENAETELDREARQRLTALDSGLREARQVLSAAEAQSGTDWTNLATILQQRIEDLHTQLDRTEAAYHA